MRIPVTNNTKMPIYCGANMIPPGETRDFEEQDVPLHLRPQVSQAPEVEEVAPSTAEALKAGSVKDAIAALGTLTDEQLSELDKLETADQKPRKTLLDAIAEEVLKRAGDLS